MIIKLFIYSFIYLFSTASYLLPGGFVAGVTEGLLGEDTVQQEKKIISVISYNAFYSYKAFNKVVGVTQQDKIPI